MGHALFAFLNILPYLAYLLCAYATIVKNWWSELAHSPLFRLPANAVFMNSYVTVLCA